MSNGDGKGRSRPGNGRERGSNGWCSSDSEGFGSDSYSDSDEDSGDEDVFDTEVGSDGLVARRARAMRGRDCLSATRSGFSGPMRRFGFAAL